MAAAEEIPLPRPHPPLWVEPHSFAEAVADLADFAATDMSAQPSDCDKRLAPIAAFLPLPRLIGPGACGGSDMVMLQAALNPAGGRIEVKPAAVLSCDMAESVAAFLRDEAAPQAAKLGSALVSVENYDSYECRSRNRVAGAKISEHAHGLALDLRALHLADGRRLELTDPHVDKPLREALHEAACHRFTTVLGPGADSYHSGHIHLDIIGRNGGYRICQWDVREPSPPTVVAGEVPLPQPRPAEAPVNHSRKL
jgi:hypothetical protein